MSKARPRIGSYFVPAYRDANRIFRVMWPAVAIILVMIFAVSLAGQLAVQLVHTELGSGVVEMLAGGASAFLTAPYLIALYKNAATGEVVARPETLRNTEAGQRFWAWSVLVSFAVAIPQILYSSLGIDALSASEVTPDNVNIGALTLVLALLIVVWVLSIRLTTLLPALALDPDRGSFRQALEDSRGHFWYIVLVLLITLLPLVLAEMVVAALIGAALPFLLVPIGAVMNGITLVLAIAVTTRLYQTLTTR